MRWSAQAKCGAVAFNMHEAVSGKLFDGGVQGVHHPKHSAFRARPCESDKALDVGPREFNRKVIVPSHGIA
jgi:hypothetical protein